ncbi:MAG: hypothetical protein HOO94_05260 [Novosphingobium sp.]|uniref:hypothetical protein n=1 Tax=Novosphingobium sp. TaxID=1874826 RepID=UPI0017F5B110|nr:hypothetical protein [Novosphingobium sp.]
MYATGTPQPALADLRELSRAETKAVLSESQAFLSMPMSEQQVVYRDMLDETYNRKLRANGLARPFATDSGKEMGFKGYNPGFEGSVDAFEDLVDSVDFPAFVADLLKAVFDANLKVMKQQTDSFIKLMKEASKSAADFIKQVKDDESFAKLAENRSDQYNVISERGSDGTTKLHLTDPTGEKVDLEDAAVKRALFEAKLAMAKEHRAALREIILMGVTRLVVRKGEIEASVEFTIKANRNSKSRHEDQNINTVNAQFDYDPPLFGLFGGPSGSVAISNTNIQVNTAEKTATDDLTAQLKGKVKIEFATDYFKLDNFANMYADGGVGAIKPAAPGGAPALPGAPRA